MTDVTFAITSLANGKAPCLCRVYVRVWQSCRLPPSVRPLSPVVYQSILNEGQYLPSGFQAHIKFILQKGKDPKKQGSYFQISLLNLDSKILFKNQKASLNYAHPDSSLSSWLHPRAYSHLKYSKGPYCSRAGQGWSLQDLAIITLDAEKAFDNVSFHWLWLVLQSFGFSGSFLHLISSMDSSTLANVITAGHI